MFKADDAKDLDLWVQAVQRFAVEDITRNDTIRASFKPGKNKNKKSDKDDPGSERGKEPTIAESGKSSS